MASINDLEREYLIAQGAVEPASLLDMRAEIFTTDDDKTIQQFYVAASTLSPVESFSVNDNMISGLTALI